MTYATSLASISRKPCTKVEIDLDFCSLEYGTSPCTASGSSGMECYNTFHTCQDKTNYDKTTKTYKFSSMETPVPFPGVRPYILSVSYTPTEIKGSFTVKTRVKIDLADEPDTDVGIDPYVDARASVQGTFWKKLLARNPNYRGRVVRIYEGFLGDIESEFQERFVGTLDNITLSETKVQLEVVDLLEELNKVEIPAKTDTALNVAIDNATTTIVLTGADVDLLDSAGYVKIGEELIQYTGLNTTTNSLTGCTRAVFGTVADDHSANAKVQPCYYFAPDHPFDHMDTILFTEAGIAAARKDTDEWAYWRDFPATDINFSALIHEPTKASTLFWELADIANVSVWQNEAQKITIRKNLANEPGRSYGAITDATHIIEGSGSADLNAESRKTRIILYWDRAIMLDAKEAASYQAIEIAVDADAESADEYNDMVEEKIFCRWIRRGYLPDEDVDAYVELFVRRRLMQKRDAQEIISFAVELKDEGLKTGDSVKLTTDELLEIDGSPLTARPYMITKREPKGNQIKCKSIRLPKKKICFIAPEGHPDFDDATDAEKEYGFISDAAGMMSETVQGYHIF